MLRFVALITMTLCLICVTAVGAVSREWGVIVASETFSESSYIILQTEHPDHGRVGLIVSGESAFDPASAQRLIFNGRAVADPICSPDGERLAFTFQGYLHVYDTHGQSLGEILLGAIGYAGVTISNGADQVAFSGRNNLLYVADTATTQSRVQSSALYDGVISVRAPSISPDGAWVLFEANEVLQPYNSDIYLMPADGSRAAEMIAWGISPAWSPDGTLIAYASANENNYDIYLLDVARQAHFRLTRTPGYDLRPSWSPDGGQIAFVSLRNRTPELFLMNANGSDPRRVNDMPIILKICFLNARPESLIEQ